MVNVTQDFRQDIDKYLLVGTHGMGFWVLVEGTTTVPLYGGDCGERGGCYPELVKTPHVGGRGGRKWHDRATL